MKKFFSVFLTLTMGYFPAAQPFAQEQVLSEDALIKEAKSRIQHFSVALKKKLQEAIANGGLKSGVKVCHQQAPVIAKTFSTDGWTVARTSLRTRNATNAASDWERQTLLEFTQKRQQGSTVNTLIKTTTDKVQFRYMQAIPTAGLCLACYGANIAVDVKQAIKNNYPNDTAVDFNVGDIRGAFSLTFERTK
ncbi:DUF3365 domain-containing protein [Pseudoalteromonas mariniglutinosa]|uniref:Tll0287-like domain-containing protein n=1 Tax=Pseudoalteromonas mariniglutinosa TaxID=206042 RepID=UPI00384AD2C7